MKCLNGDNKIISLNSYQNKISIIEKNEILY